MKNNILLKTINFKAPFIGRQKELQWLENYLDQAMDYNGNFIIVQGEIGVGKTTLINQFTEIIKTRNFHLLSGRAIMDNIMPYSPFTKIVENYFCNLDYCRSWLAKCMEPEIASYLIYLMPKLKDYYPLEISSLKQSIDDISFKYSFYRLLENLSKTKPLVIIIDDIHWLNDDSLQFLEYLRRRIVNLPVLIISTRRLNEDSPGLLNILDKLNLDRLVSTIELSNFSQIEVEGYINKIFNESLSKNFSLWLFSITKGNPLFIEEIVKTLIRQNIIFYDANKDQWIITEDYHDFPIPKTVESVINYRIGILTKSELKILQNAAIIGEKFNLATLEKLISSMPQKQFSKSYAKLVNSGLINIFEDQQQFSHPLIFELIDQKIRKAGKRKLHRKLAEILKKNKASNTEIAFHLTKDLTVKEWNKDLAIFLFTISKDLIRNYNYKIAWEYLTISHKIAEKINWSDKMRIKIKAEYNFLSWLLGRDVIPFEQVESFVAILVKNNLDQEAVGHYRLLFHRNLLIQDLKKAEKFLEKAISLIGNESPLYWTLIVERCLLLRRKGLLEKSEKQAKKLSETIPKKKAPEALYKVFTHLGLVSYLKGNLTSAYQYITKALNIVKEHHLLIYTADCYSNLGLIEMGMGKLDSAIDKFNNSINQAELYLIDPLIGINLLYLGCAFSCRGEYQRSIKYFEQAKQKAQKINNPRLKLTAQIRHSQALVKLGEIAKGELMINEIPEQEIDKGSYCDLLIVKSLIYLQKKQLSLADQYIDKSLAFAKKMHIEMRYVKALGIKSILYLQRNNHDQANECFEKAKQILISKGEITILVDLFLQFGLELSRERGEEIFIEGLKLLFDMGAQARISHLNKSMEHASFNKAIKFVKERNNLVSVKKISISTFGGLSVKKLDNLNKITVDRWKLRKAQELLSLIIIKSKLSGTTREILMTYLWPEVSKKKAQLNFRVALNQLNKVLGDDVVYHKGIFIKLNEERVIVDFWEFNKFFEEWKILKKDGKDHLAEDRAIKAVNLYQGVLFPEFYCQPIVDKQRELERVTRDLLYWLASRCLQRVEWKTAIHYAQKMLILDSYDEQACQIIMESLLNQGDRTGAIKQFERFNTGLIEELNIKPSPETLKMYENIKNLI